MPGIGPISNLLNDNYSIQNNNSLDNGVYQPMKVEEADQKAKVVQNAGETTEKKTGRRSSPAECETCKRRKYQDGSDEANVSFKSASHIDPASSGAKVMAHEAEHVSNAFTKAAQNNGKVISAVVSMHTAVCPECGRVYVAGGTTNTKIAYYDDDNGYGSDKNTQNAINYNGKNVDIKG